MNNQNLNLKPLVSVLLTSLLVIVLAACGATESVSTTPVNPPDPPTKPVVNPPADNLPYGYSNKPGGY